jgi:O-succinylbenzoic acid--CoA ligase
MEFRSSDDMKFLTLTIKGQSFKEKDLNLLCRQKLSEEKLPDWERNLYSFIQDWISNESAIEVKTSGSTGSPRRLRIEKSKMIQSALLTGKFFHLNPGDNALLCLPVGFIAGKMMVVRSFVLGLNLIPVEPKGSPLENLNNDFVFAAMTPMQMSNILKESGGFDKLNRIEKLIIGGADIHPDLLQKIRLLKNESYHTYGMTETLTHIAVRRLNAPGENDNFKALPGIRFQKDDRSCLAIIAPHLRDSKIQTNDIIELISDTAFRFLGRIDFIINSGGIKLSPEEIELKLNPFIQRRFIIAGFPDDRLGQKIVLIIEGSPNEKIDLKKLAEKAGLSKFETPGEVIYSDRFPSTESGKVIRGEIIILILGRFATAKMLRMSYTERNSLI